MSATVDSPAVVYHRIKYVALPVEALDMVVHLIGSGDPELIDGGVSVYDDTHLGILDSRMWSDKNRWQIPRRERQRCLRVRPVDQQ